jgi:signal transduction histidine kinase
MSDLPRPGRIAPCVVALIKAQKANELEVLLRAVLPHWHVSGVVIKTSQELLELQAAAILSRDVGVPRSITNVIGREVEQVATIVGQSCDRLAAVAQQNISSCRLEEGLQEEERKLETLAKAIHRARESLAELTLAGRNTEELRVAEDMLTWLGQVTQQEALER